MYLIFKGILIVLLIGTHVMATDKIENLVASHSQRLGINPVTAIDNALQFADIVGLIENEGKLTGKNPKSTAKGLYQFVDESAKDAADRLVKYLPEDWVKEVQEGKRSVEELDWEQQTLLFLGDILEKKGSDKHMVQVLQGDRKAMEDAYYTLHHTKPDRKTIARTNRILYGTQDNN